MFATVAGQAAYTAGRHEVKTSPREGKAHPTRFPLLHRTRLKSAYSYRVDMPYVTVLLLWEGPDKGRRGA